MKVKSFALAGVGTMLITGVASAAFTGIATELYVGDGWMDNGYGATGLETYRVYADFDGMDAEDGVLSVFGVAGPAMSMTSGDGFFHNDPLGGLTAPLDLRGAGLWGNQWDTYVTINATDDTVVVGLSPGFAAETNSLASDWSTENAGWFVTPDDDWGKATWSTEHPGRVMLAQFSVAAGAGIEGTISILDRATSTEIRGLRVTSATPTPGALALLGLAGLAGRRRRR